jgi:TP901 family phage tail tape measure protein
MSGEGTNVGRIYVSLGLKNETGPDIAKATASIKTLENAFKSSGKNIESSLGNAFKGITTQSASLGNTVSKNIGNAFSGISSKISSSLTGAKSAISSFAASSVSAFNSLTAAGERAYQKMGFFGTAMAAIFTYKIKNAIQEATSVFMKFDDQMRKVQAVTESTGTQFDELTAQARLLGATTSFTAQEAAEAMTLLGQAGFDANEVIAAMPATLNLARASMTDLGTTADIMSNIMNGFRLGADETERASDILSKAANATNTDVTQLGNAMKYVAPLAYQMGWSLEETASAAGLLSNAGIKSSMAGTVLRNSISRLLSPTAKAQGILASYGITLDAISPKTHDFAQIIDILSQSGISAADVMTVFGMRAGPGILAMMNIGTGAIRNMNQALVDSAGYAQAAADKMDAGWGGTVRRLNDMVESLQISFGGAFANILTPFLRLISVIGVAISQLPAPIIHLAAAFALITVATGTLLVGLAALPVIVKAVVAGIGLLQPVIIGIGQAALVVTGSVTALTTAMEGGLVARLALLVAGVGGVTTALVALGFVFYELEKKTQIFSKTWETLKDLWTIGTYYLGKAFDSLKKVVGDAIDGIMESLRELSEDTWLGRFIDNVAKAYDRISESLGKWRKDTHETAEAIREDEARQAESTANVQKQIERAHEGIVTSYQTVDEATGETYSSMIENASEAEGSISSTNDSLISSNNGLVDSYGNVAEAAAGVFTLENSDITKIVGDTAGTLESINGGIELADGSMIKFNESGQLVIETVDGIQRALASLPSQSLETTAGNVIDIISSGTGGSGGSSFKKVSLEDAKLQAEEQDKYLKSTEYSAKQWEAQTGHTVVFVDEGTQKTKSRPHTKGAVSTANDAILNDAGQVKKSISLEESLRRNTEFSSGTRRKESLESGVAKIGIVDPKGYADAIKRQALEEKTDAQDKGIQKALTDDIGWSGFFKTLFSGNIGTALGGSSPKEGGTFSKMWEGLNYKIPGAENYAEGSFDLSGVLKSYDKLKEKMGEVDSFSFGGLLGSIKNIGSEQDTATGKAETHRGVLGLLEGSKLGNLWDQIKGVGTEQDTAAGKGESHRVTLSDMGSVIFTSLQDSVRGIGTEQDTSKGKGEEHRGILETLESFIFTGLASSIQSIGTEQDTAKGKGEEHQSTLDIIKNTIMTPLISELSSVGSEEDTSNIKAGLLKAGLDIVVGTSMGPLVTQILGVGSQEDTTSGKTISLTSLLRIAGGISFSGTISSIKSVISTINDAITAAGRLIVKLAEAAKAKVSEYVSNSSSSASKASQMTASEKATRDANNAVYNNNVKINTVNNINSSKSTSGLTF